MTRARPAEVGKACDFDAPCLFELMCMNGTDPARSAFCDQGICVDFTLQICR